MKQLLVENPFTEKTQIFRYQDSQEVSIQSILLFITQSLKLNHQFVNDFRFILNGKQVQSNIQLACSLEHNSILRVLMRIRGGKGGFGSQLKKDARAQKKITDWDLSRDLQGRRMRDVNNEKKLVEFFKKQKQEQEQVDKELKEFKDMQKEQGNQNFGYQIMNNDYKDRIEKVEESISSSVLLGIKKQKQNKNKPSQEQQEEYEKDEDGFKIPKKLKKSDQNPESPIEGEIKQEFINSINSEESDNKSEKQEEKVYQLPFTKSDLKQEEISTQNLDSVDENKLSDSQNSQQKQSNIDKNKLIAIGEIKEFDIIELDQIKSTDDLIKLGDAHLKHELTRLGIKAGGKLEEKAQRLWAIKQDPSNLFNPKYLAKKK
ncbi:telomere stability/silencing protein (macronuclear) [Tetrahymena thermophila SB210]|uniref:Telomere stability/silencing protein n=1 Tax=Tetrahymena thermophila (strain SB210) TaxID=312017 RepID=I7MKS8_TETTS|nr:telomere stability/silencing protein [Tetrahymena thermophila SB210]EAS00240.1 telomere stability/silencing protein [Tetrahymena thermophila SB210]|eukprot:XP_001020485.1 telomere stability/silencing protein [Tetrahymena thermophila SB210]